MKVASEHVSQHEQESHIELLEKSSYSQNSVPSHGFDTKQESIGMQ